MSKVVCSCGWSWNKSDSSKKDMYVCHNCGNANAKDSMKNGGWLDAYNEEVPQAQNGIEGTMAGLTDKGFNYNGAWGGQFQTGGEVTSSDKWRDLAYNDPRRKEYAKKAVAEAERRLKERDFITYDEIPQNVKDASAREDKDPYTCIGGVCDVYKSVGVLDNIDWSNTSFAKNAKDYGFTANQGWGVKGINNLEPGDVVQYSQHENESGKYYPNHSTIYLGKSEDGMYRFFDNQAQSEVFKSESEIKDYLDPSKNNTQINASIYKVNPYSGNNPFNLSEEELIAYNNKKDQTARDLSSGSDYN